MYSSDTLTLNIVPVSLSSTKIKVGVLPNMDKESYEKLRDENWQTHAFRFDSRIDKILNIVIKPGNSPMGDEIEVDTEEHLLLVAKAIQQCILTRIAPSNLLLRGGKQLLFLGQADQSLLLKQAAAEAGAAPVQGLEVAVRYEIDCRLFWDPKDVPYLGLVIDVATSNIIDIPIADLLKKNFSVVGKMVCRRGDIEHPYLHPRLEALGLVSSISGDRLLLTDTSGEDQIAADQALIEPRLENLEKVINLYYGSKARNVLEALRRLRAPLGGAMGKLQWIRSTLERLKQRRISIANQVEIQLGDLLQENHPKFPFRIQTERPVFLVGPQGKDTPPSPDSGITNIGPYKYIQHARNRPLVAVICESQYRGRVDQFLQLLIYGYPDIDWRRVYPNKDNPFSGGLVGKYHLVNVRIEVEECADLSPASYRSAIKRLLQRLPELPDLALVQIRKNFKLLRGADNPYYVSKAALMQAEVPTQSVTIDEMDPTKPGIAYVLNNIALASYAKLDGIPWVISMRGPITHELIIGLGSSEVSSGRLGPKTRYVGVTTVFQGDGRYLVWGLTREAEYDDYANALLESLRTTIRYVRGENDWQIGDEVRLIFHVYKPLKDREVEAIKKLVRELVDDLFLVKFAFLDISWSHPYQIIDPRQKGRSYGSFRDGKVRGQGIPPRGLCLQISKRRGLLHLTGPTDIKTDRQGLPKPLLAELHYDSDFDDMAYLLRQLYQFTFMSWQTFFPASEPVTIKYSRMIARILGNLNLVPGWDSTVLTVGSLRNRRWFL